MICKHVLVSGLVQGVGYRAWTRQEARLRQLTGWVRNCEDGRVEALLQGEADTVSDMLEAMQQGPAMARVDGIVTNDDDSPAYCDFEVTP
ncbi:MAG: acylphosphatase [Pseudomonadales bacterium]|nr:acylphosphatase [Pseudomonadales bacterium]